MYLAAKMEQTQLVEFLLKKGADPWMRTSSGKLPMHATKNAGLQRLLERAMVARIPKRFLREHGVPKFLRFENLGL